MQSCHLLIHGKSCDLFATWDSPEGAAAGQPALTSGTTDSWLSGSRFACPTLAPRCLTLLGFERKFQKFRAVTPAFTKWPLRAYTTAAPTGVPRTEPGCCTWTGENAGCGAKSGAEMPGAWPPGPNPSPAEPPFCISNWVISVHRLGVRGDRAVPRTTGDRGVPPTPSETQSWASLCYEHWACPPEPPGLQGGDAQPVRQARMTEASAKTEVGVDAENNRGGASLPARRHSVGSQGARREKGSSGGAAFLPGDCRGHSAHCPVPPARCPQPGGGRETSVSPEGRP